MIACATGTQTIGEGAEVIRRGAADIIIVGGTEALMKDFSFAGFAVMRALPVNYNDEPERASGHLMPTEKALYFQKGLQQWS